MNKIMKGGTLFVTNAAVLVAGIIMIAASRRPDFLHTIIFITGILFIVPGLINMFVLGREGKRSPENPKGQSQMARVTGWATCGAALILGTAMCIVPEEFRPLLVYIFAIALLLGGGYHIYMISRGLRPVRFPAWVYALPLLMVIAAGVMLFVPSLKDASRQSTVILITGIGMVVFAVTSIVEKAGVRAVNRMMRRQESAGGFAKPDRQIEDANAEEIK